MTNEDLMAMLAAKRKEIGAAELAMVLDVSEVTIRSVTTGNYPGNPQKVLDKFARHYVDVVDCPHAGRNINRTDCKQRAHGPKPFGGAAKLAWWQACQGCGHK